MRAKATDFNGGKGREQRESVATERENELRVRFDKYLEVDKLTVFT